MVGEKGLVLAGSLFDPRFARNWGPKAASTPRGRRGSLQREKGITPEREGQEPSLRSGRRGLELSRWERTQQTAVSQVSTVKDYTN